MAKPYDLKRRTAVVTGAAGGIGRAISMALAKRDCDLVLVDVDEAGLIETRRLVGATVATALHQVDLAQASSIMDLRERLAVEQQRIDLVINNAGVALGGRFEDVTEANFDWLMAINFDAVVRMTRALLPRLRQSDDAYLVNVSSIFGIIAPAGQTAYSASKFAVRGFSEALRHELEGEAVKVLVVHPGGVDTSIARNARITAGDEHEREAQRRHFQAKLKLTPAQAAEQIVRAIEQRRERILVGQDAKLADVIQRLAPAGYWSLLRRASA